MYDLTPVTHGDGVRVRQELALVRKGSKKYKDTVHLLLLENKHVCLIKDFNMFVKNFTNDRRKFVKENPLFCSTCLGAFTCPDDLKKHQGNCELGINLLFKKHGEKLSFSHHHKTHLTSHIAFLDSEAIVKGVDRKNVVEAEHFMISYSVVIIDRNGEVVYKKTEVGEDVASSLISNLKIEWGKIREERCMYPIDLTPTDVENFNKQRQCELCNKRFKDGKDKHRHHLHTKSELNYVGAYCSKCNLACSDRYRKLPIFIHNMSYDMGLILRQMKQKEEITILPKQALKFLQVRIGNLEFLDSLQFLNGSLDSLARDFLKAGKEPHFTYQLLDEFNSEAQRQLVTGKQHFPYEYLNDASKLNDEQLPPKECFYSKLKDRHITDEEYEEAQKMWIVGKCKTLRDYMLIYLRIDTGLLCDIFISWRSLLHKQYGLDIAQYISLPGFAYNAFLKQSGVELDYPYDRELYELIQNNVRGGFTSTIKQKVTANNKHIDPNFKGKSNYLLYLDFNSLYAGVMTQPLPLGGFQKLSDYEREEFLKEGIESFDCNGDTGYWLLIDTKPISP